LRTPLASKSLCLHCNYPLQSLSEHRCPECGRAFDPNDPETMNVTRRPVGALTRRIVRGLPVWPVNVAAVVLIGWEFWVERYKIGRTPFPAESLVSWAWIGLWIIFGVLMALPGTVQSLWLIPGALCRRPSSIRYAVFPLLAVAMCCCSQCDVPFWAAFEISRPSLDRFAQQTLNGPLRFSYPDRRFGLFDASVIEAVPGRIILKIGATLYLVCYPEGQFTVRGDGRDLSRLGGSWYMATATVFSIYDLQDDHVKLLEAFARGEYQPQYSVAELVKSLGNPLNSVEQMEYQEWLGTVPDSFVDGDLPAESFNDSLVRPDMRALVRLGKAAVPELSLELGGSNNMMQRRVCQVLALIGPQAASATPALVKALNDSDPLVREMAAYALGQIKPKSPQVVSALLANLNDPDPCVRYTSAEALAELHPDAGLVLPGYGNYLDRQLSATPPSASVIGIGPPDSASSGWQLANQQVLEAIVSYGKDAAPLAPLLVRKYALLLPIAQGPEPLLNNATDPCQLRTREYDLATRLCDAVPLLLVDMGPPAKAAAPELWDIISHDIATNMARRLRGEFPFFTNVWALAAIAPGYPPAVRGLMADLEERRSKFIAAYGKRVTLDNIPPELDCTLLAPAIVILDRHNADFRSFLARDRKAPRNSARWAWRRSITIWVDPDDFSSAWSDSQLTPRPTLDLVRWLEGAPLLPAREITDLRAPLAAGDRWQRVRAVMTLKALGVAARPLREDLEQHALGDVDGEVRYAASLALKQIPAPAESR